MSRSTAVPFAARAVFSWVLLSFASPSWAGPVAYWNFDGHATDLAGSNHGTLNGAATFSATNAAPIPGNVASLELNGTEGTYVSVMPQTGSVNGSYTVSTWASIRGDATPNNIFSTRRNGEMSFDMKFQRAAVPTARIHGDIGGHNAAGGAVWGNTAADYLFNYNVDQWYHVAYVVTPTNWKIFVDGAQAASGVYTPNTLVLQPLLWDNNHQISIGRYNTGSEHANAFIDDISLYNYALTSAQVASLAAGTSPLAIASPDRHGALAFRPITSDADSGISASKTYTHALDFGSGTPVGALINGVQFEKAGTGNFPSGNGSTNLPLSHPGNSPAVYAGMGGMTTLLQDMIYNAPEGVLSLTGLTPGQAYDTRLYVRNWTAPNPGSRQNHIEFDIDGDGLFERMTRINEDNAIENPPGAATANQAYALSYTFVAQSPGLTIRTNQIVGNATLHLYGLTNEETDRYPIDTLYSTGLNVDGSRLLGGEPDPHYFLFSVPAGETPVAVAAANHPVWAPNDGGSGFIGVRDPGNSNSQGGEYGYATYFDLTGYVPDTAEVVLSLFSDNRITDVLLNGVSTGITLSAADGNNHTIGRGKTFTLTEATAAGLNFLPGLNTLEFITFNDAGTGPNPGGFRADLSGTAQLIPEPTTAVTVMFGLLALGVYAARRLRFSAGRILVRPR